MKFPYLKLRHQDPHQKFVLTPWIPVSFEAHDQKYEILALVDSGADYCIFDSSVATFLGVNVKNGHLEKTEGISGKEDIYYFDNIWINAGGYQIKVRAGFVTGNLAGGSLGGVLGRQGFFDYFKVCIDESAKEIELKPKS